VERKLWLAAALVAGARKRANDPIRASDRDRGLDKSLLNDIQGALGEIVGGQHARSTLGVRVADDLLALDGPVDRVGLVFNDGAGELRLESTRHLLAPGKRCLLINARARLRSVQRGAHGCLPAISALGRGVALLGPVIGTTAAKRWGEPLSLPDPAIGIRLDELCAIHLEMSLDQVESLIDGSTPVAMPEKLIAIASHATPGFDPKPSLAGLGRRAEAML